MVTATWPELVWAADHDTGVLSRADDAAHCDLWDRCGHGDATRLNALRDLAQHPAPALRAQNALVSMRQIITALTA